VSVPLDGLRVVHKPLQEDTGRHEGYLRNTLGTATLHPYLVANSLPDSLSKLLSHSVIVRLNCAYLFAMLIAAILRGCVHTILHSALSKSAFSSKYFGT